jgi:hypothetical protein
LGRLTIYKLLQNLPGTISRQVFVSIALYPSRPLGEGDAVSVIFFVAALVSLRRLLREVRRGLSIFADITPRSTR